MKKIIRNFTMALAALFMVSVTAMADDDKPIEFSQLPQAAQTTVKKRIPFASDCFHHSGRHTFQDLRSALLEWRQDRIRFQGKLG